MKFGGLTLFDACMECSVCDGAGYQAPPALFVGNLASPILIVGPSPNEITEPLELAELKDGHGMSSDVFYTLFQKWFTTEPISDRIGRLLSYPSWWDTFLYTAHVRCRTKGDLFSSNQKRLACSVWTSQLAHQRKGLIVLGMTASLQVFGADITAKIVTRRLSKFKGKLALPLTLEAEDEDADRKAVVAFLKKVGVS